VLAEAICRTVRASVCFIPVSGDGEHLKGLRPVPAIPSETVDERAARRRFEEEIATHLPALRACAARLCRRHHDADDLVQDALLRAFRTRSQVHDPARIRAWLLTIVTNTFIDLTRKHRRRPEHVDLVVEAPVPDPAEPAPWDHVEPEDVLRAIEQLPDDVRETYRKFAVEGMDYIAIAEAQQIPRATVGSRIFRARKRLRALLAAAPEAGKGSGKTPQ